MWDCPTATRQLRISAILGASPSLVPAPCASEATHEPLGNTKFIAATHLGGTAAFHNSQTPVPL